MEPTHLDPKLKHEAPLTVRGEGDDDAMVHEEHLPLLPLDPLRGPHVPEEEGFLGPQGPMAQQLGPTHPHQHAQTYDVVCILRDGRHDSQGFLWGRSQVGVVRSSEGSCGSGQ